MIPTVSPTVDPEQPTTTTSPQKINIARALPLSLVSPYSPCSLT